MASHASLSLTPHLYVVGLDRLQTSVLACVAVKKHQLREGLRFGAATYLFSENDQQFASK